MKHFIYGIAGVLALTAAIPAQAQAQATNTMPMQAQPPAVETRTITRTIVVRETPLYGQQIATAIEGREDATSFHNVMAANGLSISLRDDEDGYTAFVPVNDAFARASINAPSGPAANGTINADMRGVLEQHIVDSKYDINLLHGNRDNITALSGNTITISKMGNHYYANGQLIVDRQHDPEGIIYFIEDFVTAPGFSTAVYNPANVKK